MASSLSRVRAAAEGESERGVSRAGNRTGEDVLGLASAKGIRPES